MRRLRGATSATFDKNELRHFQLYRKQYQIQLYEPFAHGFFQKMFFVAFGRQIPHSGVASHCHSARDRNAVVVPAASSVSPHLTPPRHTPSSSTLFLRNRTRFSIVIDTRCANSLAALTRVPAKKIRYTYPRRRLAFTRATNTGRPPLSKNAIVFPIFNQSATEFGAGVTSYPSHGSVTDESCFSLRVGIQAAPPSRGIVFVSVFPTDAMKFLKTRFCESSAVRA